eukprot:TRINITY_DN1968_c0_g1_i1.p1 TRINITY_DN1968_c0_g1~~TRINITY_DN1968_c0_g1_i1.p1  ORF type:complete len:327 (+),score=70.97 TRINITY_DN1968_c0_g1_i1:232-1212(+)
MDPFGHARKKARSDVFMSENGGFFKSQEPPVYGDSGRFKTGYGFAASAERETIQSALGSKKACTKYFSTSGCPYGGSCHFLHYVPGGVNAVSQVQSINTGLNSTKSSSGFLSTEQNVPVSNYKTRLCTNYGTPEGCRFGDKCHFAHGERELAKGSAFIKDAREERIPGNLGSRVSGILDAKLGRPGYREPTPPGMAAAAKFGESVTAKIPVDASLVGAIIGKGGSNSQHIRRVTGVKFAIKDEESDSGKNVIELVGSIDQIKEASAMVKQLIMHVSAVAPGKQGGTVTNNYKTKLCENFAQGTCTFGDRCHFAHGASELREAQKSV